jgi:tRNA (cmo5U34)-methyltransferase
MKYKKTAIKGIKLKSDHISSRVADWSFKGKVYKNFDRHINKSIPLYKETHFLFTQLSDYFLQNNSNIIDIGCSTGTFINSLNIRHKKNAKKLSFKGIDTAPEMITYCKKKYKNTSIKFQKISAIKANMKNSCLIISLYTIQFISPKVRQKLISKIYKELNWGGAFFFVEKVRAPDARFQDMLSQTYIEYKVANGFTANEIINKSNSLKGVMEPFSTGGNISLLKRAGFKDILTVFKYACFEGFLAIK